MNILFLLLAGILTLIAFGFILPPLWRQRTVEAADPDQNNIVIARYRLIELKDQLQSGALSRLQYNEQLAELEQALSDDLDIESHVGAVPAQGRWMAYVLVAAIPLLAGALYLTLGNYQAINPATEPVAAASPESPSLEDINKMVAKLAERMKNNPGDAQGWVMLGRSYKYLQQYSQAVEAFAQAYKLLGDQADIMLLYADALALANNESLSGKPAELVFKALALEPDNITGLWLGGMIKAQQGNAVEAIKLWRKLDALLPPGSQAQQQTRNLLAQIETQAPAADIESKTAPAKPSDASIDVQVSLAPEQQKLAGPDDTVFIYAQALSGPKMPLAIIRKQVSELPLTVSLNDAMAMTPAMKLSGFAQVKLIARISKSGNALPQPGDLIGVVDAVAVSDKSSHKIIINDQLK
jgi:cytochrome c-type biogenesis protein CcmH